MTNIFFIFLLIVFLFPASVLAAPDSSAACDTTAPVGTVCPDGTVYAGLSTDGKTPMYTTPEDASSGKNICGNNPGVYCNADAYILTTQGPPLAQAPQPCDDLTAYGHNDWHLPTIEELGVLYANRKAIGGFDTKAIQNTLYAPVVNGPYYRSSSLYKDSGAKMIRFSDGNLAGFEKYTGAKIRCIRK